MRKLLFVLLNTSAALAMAAGILPSGPQLQVMSGRGETPANSVLSNGSAYSVTEMATTTSEIATIGSQEYFYNVIINIVTDYSTRLEQGLGNVFLERDGYAVDPLGHGGVIHRPIDPRPIKPGGNGSLKAGIISLACQVMGPDGDGEPDGENAIAVEPDSEGHPTAVETADLIGSDESIVAPVSARVKGDVSGDGKISIDDVTGLIDILAGGGELPAWADVDGNGKVTIADVTALIDAMLRDK